MIYFYYVRDDGKRILRLNWPHEIKMEDLKKYSLLADEIQFWYPKYLNPELKKIDNKYISFIHQNQVWGVPSQTGIIDLNESEEKIFSSFSKTCKYEVKRAANRDHLKFQILLHPNIAEINQFLEFYNKFAITKKLPLLQRNVVESMVKVGILAISIVYSSEAEMLVHHSYIVDVEEKRVALNTSCSLVHSINDTSKKNMIGRANRYLHYQDMLFFKKNGYQTYDLNGVAYSVVQDQEHESISAFKKEFGCKREDSFESVILQTLPLNYIEENSKKKKIIVFGAGGYFKEALPFLSLSYDVVAVADNDIGKWGSTIEQGIKVISPGDILKYNINDLIVVIMRESTRDMVLHDIHNKLPEMHLGYFCYSEKGPTIKEYPNK